jgi:hypothetical protein
MMATHETTATRVVLTEADFQRLVAGQIVKQAGVEIILSDIGHVVMFLAVRDAWCAAERKPLKPD